MVFLLVAIWSHLTKEIALLNFDTAYVALCDDAPPSRSSNTRNHEPATDKGPARRLQHV